MSDSKLSGKSNNQKLTKRSFRPEIDESKLGVNPFVAGEFDILVHNRLNNGAYRKDEEGLLVNIEYSMERDSKVLFYTNVEYRDVIFGLDNSAFRLFVLVGYKLEYSKDWVWVNVPHYMKIMGVSLNTFKKGMNDLVRYGMLYPMVGLKDCYWVNPRYMFNGSRVGKYPQNVVQYEPKTKKK